MKYMLLKNNIQKGMKRLINSLEYVSNKKNKN